ncbi:MAG: hypothetical protein LQ343_002284 [Gyalolechia ehrenbergii]|nr:MAG: hypothetical protein LQ343_002284 [Gyalolechia ehrenbergii]
MSASRNTHHIHPNSQPFDALHTNGYHIRRGASRTPNRLPTPLPSIHSSAATDADLGADEDPKLSVFTELFLRTEARLEALFDPNNASDFLGSSSNAAEQEKEKEEHRVLEHIQPQVLPPQKKAARTIDEDDYDDSEGEDDDTGVDASPLKAKSTGPAAIPSLSAAPMVRTLSSTSTPAISKPVTSTNSNKTSEDARRELELNKKATEDAAKKSFHTLFYTVENDRDAMFDQKKLEESERQVDEEMSGQGHSGTPSNNQTAGNGQQGTLSQTNLGALSLTLKHLIARIDKKRDQVTASDVELRSLIGEVKKNRSKWANEDRVGQEELYEAAEKVLNELKAMTEHSTAFLSRVNKREAPDYYNVIKTPMDLGSMTKKLKNIQYKSKQEFVTDLNLIWSNCLNYNANPEHFLRRHALFMRKETEKLVPLIPAITIRDRAEVEAEERRQHQAEAELDGADESDDEPIISSRGRKAPGKKAKKGSTAPRKAPAGSSEGNHSAETKPATQHPAPNGLGSNLKHEHLRAESEAATERSITDPMTPPPPGTITPAGINGVFGHHAGSADPDAMDVDGVEPFVNGIPANVPETRQEIEYEDATYKVWKQVTKKNRALVTAERHRLFKGNEINEDEPALLRRKAGIRSWLQKQKQAVLEGAAGRRKAEAEAKENEEAATSGETLAEGIEGEEERVLPDYYDTLSAIPDLSERLRWIENTPGEVEDPCEDHLHILPSGLFTSPESALTKKIEDNMRQLQATRKICSKIGVVKQMQIQSQMYHGQFQKVEPAPLVEQDIEAHVMNDAGPVVSPEVTQAALRRSVAKMFFHAGFEEFQPSALDAVTDLASDFFVKIAKTLVEYLQTPKIPVQKPVPGGSGDVNLTWKDRFTKEEMVLHTLHENGSDLAALETYVKDETDRTSTKLVQMQDRMKAHLADLLRPALTDAGPDGSNALNDGSDQFVSGDFAADYGEDFFGFRELGLDKELGLASLAVPLHLLQNRMHSAHQSQHTSNLSSSLPSALPPPPPLPPITVDNISSQIGLVQQFFRDKLAANSNKPLIEDDDLPQKQRFPKPRLPPTGKISSPRKRPIREPGPGKGHPRKKMKLNGEGEKEKENLGLGKSPVGKLKLGIPGEGEGGATATAASEPGKEIKREKGQENEREREKPEGAMTANSTGGMMSPESLEAT